MICAIVGSTLVWWWCAVDERLVCARGRSCAPAAARPSAAHARAARALGALAPVRARAPRRPRPRPGVGDTDN